MRRPDSSFFNRHSIDKRPKIIEERKQFGHWEADNVVSMRGSNTCLATFLERKTRKYLVYKIPKKDSKSMLKAMKQLVESMPNGAVKSITCGRGTEFIHQQGVGIIEDTLGVKIYYAAPYVSYQRGSNEYHNGLLREYHPKPSNFRMITQRAISESVNSINTRSRKTLKWESAQLNFVKEYSKLL